VFGALETVETVLYGLVEYIHVRIERRKFNIVLAERDIERSVASLRAKQRCGGCEERGRIDESLERRGNDRSLDRLRDGTSSVTHKLPRLGLVDLFALGLLHVELLKGISNHVLGDESA